MRGLKRYIRKHGYHFTEQLALDAALNKRWNWEQVEKELHRRVWFNVTDSTVGDMLYLVNECYDEDNFMGYGKKSKCVSYAILYVGDFRYYGGSLFKRWLDDIPDSSFDFTPYI